MQLTPSKKFWLLGVVSGAVTFVHDVPFHMASCAWKTLPLYHCPTATQKPLPAHDTPLNSPLVPDPGLGLGTTDHVVPFQTSANETKSLLAFV